MNDCASVSSPISVKIMKDRNIKVGYYLVTKETADKPDNTADLFPSAAQLQTYLSAVFHPQLNTTFQVQPPVTISLDWDANGNGSMDAFHPQVLGPEQQRILDKRPPVRPDSDIEIFLLGTDKKIQNNTAWGLTNRGAKACWIVGDPIDNRTVPDVQQTIGHEVVHILVDYGHPDEGTGHAPLPKTNHRERLMYSGLGRGARLVKAEWDEAEKWLRTRPNGDN